MVPRDDSPSTVPPPVPDAGPAEERYFRRGLGLRQEVRGEVEADYHSALVRQFRENGYTLEREGVTFRLAREFGFCYGVERAVDYAYETVRRFPDRRIVLTGEIIHNPKVNDRLRALGIRFLGDDDVPRRRAPSAPTTSWCSPRSASRPTTSRRSGASGAVLVDTTCGSVLNVWKNVERYAREGRTSIVHGKASHEETRATVSRVLLAEGAHFLVVLDLAEARVVADTIRGAPGGLTRAAFLARFARPDVGGVRPGPPPRAHRHGQPDDHALRRVPGHRADWSGTRSRSATAPPRPPTASAPSTRSARPPRSARTR